MKKVEIISVGTELLMGQIANTNAQYISQKLPLVGLGVYFHTVCGDNVSRLLSCIKIAEERADVIIFTGGLGPTEDDLTKETVCEYLGLKEVLDDYSADKIREYFIKTGREMPESNLKMAMLPEGQTILKNDFGTAPGSFIRMPSGKIYILLPGPPRELKPMFDNYVLELLEDPEFNIRSMFVNLVGIAESSAEKKMLHLVHGQTNPTFATYAKDGILTIRVTASGENAGVLLEQAKQNLVELFPDEIYSFDGLHISDVLNNKLKSLNLNISVIETFTGGAISGMITSTENSDVFAGGIVLPEGADALQVNSNADIVIKAKRNEEGASIYIEDKRSKQTCIFNHKITGNRERIRTLTAVYALFDALKVVNS